MDSLIVNKDKGYWLIKDAKLSNLLQERNYWLNSVLMLGEKDGKLYYSCSPHKLQNPFQIERLRLVHHLFPHDGEIDIHMDSFHVRNGSG